MTKSLVLGSLLLASVATAGGVDLFGKPKIPVASISMQRVLAKSAQAQTSAKQLESFRADHARALAEKQKELETVQLQIAQNGGIWYASKRGQLRKDEERVRNELQQLRDQTQKDVQELQRRLQGEFRSVLDPVLEDLAKAHGSELILNHDTAVVWSTSRVDLTDEVISRLSALQGTSEPRKN